MVKLGTPKFRSKRPHDPHVIVVLLQIRSLRRLFFLSALLSTKVAVGIRNVPTSAYHVELFSKWSVFFTGIFEVPKLATVSFRNCPKENLLEYNACDVLYCALYATGDEWLASYFSCNFFLFQFLSIGSYLMKDEFNDHFSPGSSLFSQILLTTNVTNPDEGLYPVMKLLTPGSKETTWCGALSLSSSILNGTGSTRK